MAWEVKYLGPAPRHSVQPRNCHTVVDLVRDVWVALTADDALRCANYFAEQPWCEVRQTAAAVGTDYASDQPSAKLLASTQPAAIDAPKTRKSARE